MRRTHLLGLSLILVAGTAANAAATPYIASSAPEKPKDRRWEVDIGMLVGGVDVGSKRGSSTGVHVNAGRRMGDLSLLGEYDYQSVGSRGARGRLSRLGFVARYSLMHFGQQKKRDVMGVDWWVEAGAGRQKIVWRDGGTLARNDAVFGFGMQLTGRSRRKNSRQRYFGPYVAFRANIARAPKPVMDTGPTCAGPCDTPTRGPKNDTSLFFHFGFNFGR